MSNRLTNYLMTGLVFLIPLIAQSQVRKNANFKIKALHVSKLKKSDTKGSVTFIDESGNLVQLIDDYKDYVELVSTPNSPYQLNNSYYKTSLNLKTEGQLFYGCPVGIYKEYDDHGNITLQTDFESGYTFTIPNLIQKIKIDYNFDLATPVYGTTIFRNNDTTNNEFTYDVYLPIKDRTVRELTIDGVTGVVMSDVNSVLNE